MTCYAIIYSHTGGYRAASREKYVADSALLYCVCLMVALVTPDSFQCMTTVILVIFSVMIILCLAPAAYLIRPWTLERHIREKQISRITAVVLACCIFAMLFWFPKLITFALWASLSLAATAILLVAAKIDKYMGREASL